MGTVLVRGAPHKKPKWLPVILYERIDWSNYKVINQVTKDYLYGMVQVTKDYLYGMVRFRTGTSTSTVLYGKVRYGTTALSLSCRTLRGVPKEFLG